MAGLWFDQFVVGQRFVHEIRRTVTDMDNILFSSLTYNPAAIHIDHAYDLLYRAVMDAGELLGATVFTGILVPGLNRSTWLPNPDCHFETFFMTPELKAAGDRVTFLPFSYSDILAHLGRRRLDAALFSISPPDAQGLCSFGPTVDFLAELWPTIPLRIAHVNPLLPRTEGPTGIPLREVHAFVEGEEALPELADPIGGPVADCIADTLLNFVDDGAVLQTGIGKLPGSIVRRLMAHRRIRIHSGLIGDAVLDLLECGVIERGEDVVAGVAIGTRRIYDALPSSRIQFRPVSETHGLAVLAELRGLITINSALEVDLFGQAYCEAGPEGWASGPGGAIDFARGARAAGGVRIVALPATAGKMSRIVPGGGGRGPVSLGRWDIDVVITEFGSADLRGLTHERRAMALIAIAAPQHQVELADAWAGKLFRSKEGG